MQHLKYFEIIRELKKLKAQGEKPVLKIRILSNIIVHQLTDILDYCLRKNHMPCDIVIGNYDNIIQDAAGVSRDEVVILFWEAANIVDGFHYLVKNFDAPERQRYMEKIKDELSMVFNTLKDQKKVFINAFHSRPFDYGIIPGHYGEFVNQLNNWMVGTLPANFMMVDLTGIFMQIGLEQSFDLRNFYSSKALYSLGFFKLYSARLTPLIAALSGKIKKVLIVDCDNTLWGGVVGEDGVDGIKVSAPYMMVQSTMVELYKKGVLICLCSKNNPDDVREALEAHPNMVLKDEHILLKKVNWEDKVTNIQAIGEALNLGLSSFVFLDDSPFEINLVREQLPEVSVYQVPEKISEYPALMEEIARQFFRFASGDEDARKTKQYRVQAQRDEARKSFHSVEDYLRSLDLQITITKNSRASCPEWRK